MNGITVQDINTKVFLNFATGTYMIAFGYPTIGRGEKYNYLWEYKELSKDCRSPNGVNIWLGESEKLEVGFLTKEITMQELMKPDMLDIRTEIKNTQERLVADYNEYNGPL